MKAFGRGLVIGVHFVYEVLCSVLFCWLLYTLQSFHAAHARVQAICMNDIRRFAYISRLRPYHVESTGSRPITEVKQRRARLVLGWVTAWEYRVP